MIIFFIMKVQKILTCDANGNLHVAPRFYEGFYDEVLDELFEIEDKMTRMHKLLYFADSCRAYRGEYDLEEWAYCAYITVFRSISWRSTGEEKELLERAVGGLNSLSMSDDELMWEKCSQITGDYFIWKSEQEAIENEMLETN